MCQLPPQLCVALPFCLVLRVIIGDTNAQVLIHEVPMLNMLLFSVDLRYFLQALTCVALPIGVLCYKMLVVFLFHVIDIFPVNENMKAALYFCTSSAQQLPFYAAIQAARALHFFSSVTCLALPFLMPIMANVGYWLKMAWLS